MISDCECFNEAAVENTLTLIQLKDKMVLLHVTSTQITLYHYEDHVQKVPGQCFLETRFEIGNRA